MTTTSGRDIRSRRGASDRASTCSWPAAPNASCRRAWRATPSWSASMRAISSSRCVPSATTPGSRRPWASGAPTCPPSTACTRRQRWWLEAPSRPWTASWPAMPHMPSARRVACTTPCARVRPASASTTTSPWPWPARATPATACSTWTSTSITATAPRRSSGTIPRCSPSRSTNRGTASSRAPAGWTRRAVRGRPAPPSTCRSRSARGTSRGGPSWSSPCRPWRRPSARRSSCRSTAATATRTTPSRTCA